MGGVQITDEDHGYRATIARVFNLAAEKPSITVGIHEDKGAEAHGDVLTVLQIAIFNEFGTHDANGKVLTPERSFIRAWFDEAEPSLRQDLVKLCASVIAGKRTRADILELLGSRMVGEIQQRIADGIEPENAKSTIKQKGSSTPLVDMGVLRSSVTYKVNGGK